MSNEFKKDNYKYVAILCFIGAFMGPFAGNVVNILIPRLQKEFAVSFYSISLSISVYMIAFATFQLVSGLVSDVLGRRNVILFGYGFFGIGSIICYFAGTLGMFLSGRFIQGMSNAFMTPVLMALLGDIIPTESIGKYMGIFGSVQTSGIFLAPVVGGVFAEINWRYAFLILSLLAIILTAIYYFNFNFTSKVVKTKSFSFSLILKLIGNKKIILLSICSFAGYFGFGSLGFLFAKYIYLKFGVSESINGFIVSLTGLSSIIFSPLVGRSINKFNRVRICVIGILFIIPLIFIIPYVENAYILSVVLFSMGGFSAMVWSTINTLAVDTTPEIRGTTSSIINSFKYFSFSISPLFYGNMYEAWGIGATFRAASAVTFIQLVTMVVYQKVVEIE